MADCLVVVSKVKKVSKLRVATDAINELSEQVERIMEKATELAEKSGVRTVKAEHIAKGMEHVVSGL